MPYEGPDQRYGPVDDDLEALRTAYRECRSNLDHQIAAGSDIDDKAAHTLRIQVLLFGLIGTGLSIAVRGIDSLPDESSQRIIDSLTNILTVGSSGVLLLSMFFAIWAYTDTKFHTGISRDHVYNVLQEDATERTVLHEWLWRYRYWSFVNEKVLSKDATILFVSHSMLFIGIIIFMVGVFAPLIGFHVPLSNEVNP